MLVALAVAAVAFALRPADDPGSGQARVGDPAPRFVANDLDGERVALADFDGPVLLNFWASWCDPCRKEFPLFREVVAGGEVEVLGVVFRDQREPAADFMEEQDATWSSVLDPRERIASAYGVTRAVPVTVAIDADGLVRAIEFGEIHEDRLQQMLRAIDAA